LHEGQGEGGEGLNEAKANNFILCLYNPMIFVMAISLLRKL
jgi:hypothetical protein